MFTLDEPRILNLLERIEGEGLVLLLHYGFDIAYEDVRILDPVKIRGRWIGSPGCVSSNLTSALGRIGIATR